MVAGALSACNTDDPTRLLNGGVGGDAGSGGAPVVKTAREHWDALEPELLDACSKCHQIGGSANTPFLIGPDWYRSFVSWPGIVTKDTAQSILLTYSMNAKGHSGKNLDAPDLQNTLLPRVKEWLAAEASNFTEAPPNAGTSIDPIVPIMGFNAVYLDGLGPLFKGVALTFRAGLVGTSLELSEIELHPTLDMGIHVVHPLFIVHPLGKPAEPDLVDSFSNLDQTFEAGKSGPLGPGTVFLLNWSTDAKMSFAFEKIEAINPMGIPISGCKDVPAFQANAAGPLATCFACHDGTEEQAQAAMDLTSLLNDPALACGQVRNRINPADPLKSQIFVNSDPSGNAAHPFKFDGNVAAFGAFQANVATWVAAEQ